MKKFFLSLLSDSNAVSSKRFISLLSMIMIVAYGVAGIVLDKDENFWIFYVSVNAVTMWIGFRFMSSEKILKYGVLEKLTLFGKVKPEEVSNVVEDFVGNEDIVDQNIRPEN